jgi:hypothetical protein
MARRKNWSAEQIVAKLRQIEVQLAKARACRWPAKRPEISEQSSRTSASSGRSSTAYERHRS